VRKLFIQRDHKKQSEKPIGSVLALYGAMRLLQSKIRLNFLPTIGMAFLQPTL
jgi:hypothetical protein